jgi:hypothetical protein
MSVSCPVSVGRTNYCELEELAAFMLLPAPQAKNTFRRHLTMAVFDLAEISSALGILC